MDVLETGRLIREALRSDTQSPRLPVPSELGSPAATAGRVIDVVSRSGGVARLLDALIADVRQHPRAAQARAALSYRHALGFEKIVLLAGKPDFMLRAHIWRPGIDQREVSEHIHNHRFSFASRVLTGNLAMDIYTPHSTGEQMEWYQERVAEGDASWDLTHWGRRAIRQLSSMDLAAGSSYHLMADALHRIRPANDTVSATLCLETMSVRNMTDVYVAAGEIAPSRIFKRPFSIEEYENALAGFRELIQ
jgi:hypothetical protein